MTTKNFDKISNFIQIPINYTGEIRIGTTFYYPNSFAALLLMVMFLVLGEIIDKKIWYGSSVLFLIETSIILTYSRMTYIFLVIFIILYLIFVNGYKSKVSVLVELMLTGIFAVLYSLIFMKLISKKEYLLVWIILIIIFILIAIIKQFIYKKYNIIDKIKIKHIVTILIITIVLSGTAILIALNYTETIKIPNENEKTETVELFNINPGEKYSIDVDLQSISKYKEKEIFYITIVESNKYFDEINYTSIKFGEYEGIKSIEIQATKDTEHIFIKFYCYINDKECILNVNKLWVNGKETALRYKFIPTTLANKLKNITMKTKSAWERIELLKDGFKIATENWLFGAGGHAWRYLYGKVQNYNYNAKEPHCYVMKIWIENGILGLIALLIIFIILIKKAIKAYSENNIINQSIIIAIMSILIHSFLDFDMSFYIIESVFFILLSIINSDIESESEKNNILKKILFVTIITFVLIYDIILCAYKVEIKADKEKAYKKYEMLIPFDANIQKNKATDIKYIDKFVNNENYYYYTLEMINRCYNIALEDNNSDYINYCIKLINKAKDEGKNIKYDSNYMILRLETTNAISSNAAIQYEKTKTEEWLQLEKVCDLLITDNIEDTNLQIENYQDCRIRKSTAEEYIKMLGYIKEQTQKRIEKYEQ